MEILENEIILFIGKLFRHHNRLSPHELLEVCELVQSPAEIIQARIIVTDVYGRNKYFSQPRPTHTFDVRGDFLQIFHYLKDYPCEIGEERQYIHRIEKKGQQERLKALFKKIDDLWNIVKRIEDSMASKNDQQGQCSKAADSPAQPGSSTQGQPDPIITYEGLAVQDTAEAVVSQEFCQFPIDDIPDEPDAVGAIMQAMYVDPPLQMFLPHQGQEGVMGNPAELMVSTVREDARASTPSIEWVESDLSNLSGKSSNAEPDENVISLCSDDEMPSQNTMIPSQNRQTRKKRERQTQMRLIAPPAQRFQSGAIPEPSAPILIPQPIRVRPDWTTDDDSPTMGSDQPCLKRPRRMDRPE